MLDIIGGHARFHPPDLARINRFQGGTRAHIKRLYARVPGSVLDIGRGRSTSVIASRSMTGLVVSSRPLTDLSQGRVTV